MTSINLMATIKNSTDLTSATCYLLSCDLAKLNRLKNSYLSNKVRDAQYETLLEQMSTPKSKNAKLAKRLEQRLKTIELARMMLKRGSTKTAKKWLAAKLD